MVCVLELDRLTLTLFGIALVGVAGLIHTYDSLSFHKNNIHRP
jgi:hypothetical protein